ncbi:MAG TPA: hypothetical protein VM285_11615 [Polyangia bacterium]|nr:hypothetical protein [Polyangia bacterium]
MRNVYRDKIEEATTRMIAAQGQGKTMGKHLKAMEKIAQVGGQTDDQSAFKAKIGRGI